MNSRQLKRLVTLLVTLAPIITLTFSSCSMDDLEPVDFKAESDAIQTKSSDPFNQIITKSKRVSETTVRSILDGCFNNKQYSLEAVVNNNKEPKNNNLNSDIQSPLLYVANFDSGGWAIVAGNERKENQILAYGETGSFNPDKIENPCVATWFEMIKEQMAAVEIEEDETAEASEQANTRAYLPPYNEPYYWVRLPLDPVVSTQSSGSGHLLSTEWGQNWPWNYKCPVDGSVRCPTGCVAVAVSQILYYLHYNLGTPMGLYHGINPTYNLITNGNSHYYKIAQANKSNYTSPSSRWNAMALSGPEKTTGTDYVGNLMMDVGEHAGMEYAADGSGAVTRRLIFTYYGINCDSLAYNYSMVRASLENGQPVLSSARDATYGGHAWVIDGYQDDLSTTDNPYKWVIIPSDSLSYYSNIDYDYVFSESEMQTQHPDVQENDIEHEYEYYTSHYLRMNWGWDGSYDEGTYSILPDWTESGYHFNVRNIILRNFRGL